MSRPPLPLIGCYSLPWLVGWGTRTEIGQSQSKNIRMSQSEVEEGGTCVISSDKNIACRHIAGNTLPCTVFPPTSQAGPSHWEVRREVTLGDSCRVCFRVGFILQRETWWSIMINESRVMADHCWAQSTCLSEHLCDVIMAKQRTSVKTLIITDGEFRLIDDRSGPDVMSHVEQFS